METLQLTLLTTLHNFYSKKCHVNYKSCSYYTYDYANFSEEKFIYGYSMLDWTSLDNTSLSATNHFDNFYAKTTECVNSHIPKKKVTKKALKLRSKPWINSNIQKLMHYRDKYFKSMTKNPSTTNKYLYCKFRNRVVSEQRKGKIKYFQSYFEKNKTNMKMLWTGIKSIVNVKAKNQISQISHLLDNGSQVNDPVKMANIFNKFFVNVGPNVDKSVSRTKKSPLDFLKDRNPNSMFLAPVTPQEIETITRLLNTKNQLAHIVYLYFYLRFLADILLSP